MVRRTPPRLVGCGIAVVGLAAVLLSGASAGLVPGGGPQKSDCYAEFDVDGISNPQDVVRNKLVSCMDGDECDSSPCGDAVCTFGVRVCWNQNDPNVSDCDPPASLDSL